MFQVQCLQSSTEGGNALYAKYSIGPFIKGQSTTIGNALRRVLLSNIQGLAIIGVRIAGINHEFSTILNVKEDVIDILLNLKQIMLKGNITEPVLARLVAKKAGNCDSRLDRITEKCHISGFGTIYCLFN
jgi:DNA-directed RNA polymerase subunit alpha